MVYEPVEYGRREDRIGEHLAPRLEWFVRRDDDRAAFVAFGDYSENMIGDDAVERREPQFIENDEIGRYESVSDFFDR